LFVLALPAVYDHDDEEEAGCDDIKGDKGSRSHASVEILDRVCLPGDVHSSPVVALCGRVEGTVQAFLLAPPHPALPALSLSQSAVEMTLYSRSLLSHGTAVDYWINDDEVQLGLQEKSMKGNSNEVVSVG
jgi:hypothetical protein